ncbi:porin family protein [Rhizobiales bacterium]|uniref:outer membrane protein n=1 Tax=Hongsoonwoonella zoysiae TaxID=2821844 RepID=UPI00155FC3CF|nr:outer membrane protein [Hongsoonwoonella zoysiae]NRG17396.1 porin family protein [Hongsoonwoonella zoysiae]
MKSFAKVLSLAGVAIVVSSVSFAADLPAPVIEHVPEVPVATGGWYLRGDIGYKIYVDPDAGFSSQSFQNESMDDTAVIGVGVGYKFNEYFRTDLTVDYEFKSEFDSRTPCPACGPGGTPGVSLDSADIDVWTILFNAYVDLGTYNGFTPYVGGGIGASYINVGQVYSNVGTPVRVPGDSRWDFSWALMAGASYAFNPNLSVDAGYRYLNIGDGYSDTFTAGATTAKVKYEDLQAHEFRVGLRYTFDSAPTYLPVEPIATKF